MADDEELSPYDEIRPPPPSNPVIVARERGRCAGDCGDVILPGETIVKIGDGWFHEECRPSEE